MNVDSKEESGGTKCIHEDRDRDQWRAVANRIIKLQNPYKGHSF